MPSYQWSSRIKIGTTDDIFRPSPRFEVTTHPLKLGHLLVNKPKPNTNEILDPLTAADESDPLSQFVHETLMLGDTYPEDEGIPHTDSDGSKAWISKKYTILNKYTTMEKLSIISSFLPGGEKMASRRRAANVSEQVKHRLEQLDEFDDGSERQTIGLTQQEYATKIAMLNEELVTAWNTEQRVKALKIAIQCSKLLADTSVMQFYPSKFVLITDILDTFGNLVFERLVGKSFKKHALPTKLDQIDPAAVADSAKETCQNWLYKMASIRELMPRLYIEMSLLKCYIFLSRNEFDSAIARLTRMIRGVGNPLVAVYARCYLCRVALNVLTKNKDFFVHNLQEFLMIYKQIFEANIRREYEVHQSLNKDMYLSLYVPALDWLFYGAIHFGSHPERLLDTVLTQCEDIPNKDLLLYSIVSSFSSKNITVKASRILEIIGTSETLAMKHEILYLVGEHMCNVRQVSRSLGEALVQACWRITAALGALPHFLRVLEPWMEFASVHLSSKHLNILLRGIIKYVSKCEESVDDYSPLLLSIIKRMLRNVDDVEELFLMDGFMPLLDMIQATQPQIEMARSVLALFFEKQTSPAIEDHVIIGALMRLCKILHDSVNAMTVEDEKRVVSELVSRLVQRVTFHGDWEDQLAFYVECRAAFINLDAVLLTLVYCVTRLSVDAGGGKETGGGGGGGARACAAFCFITLPSLGCALLKAQLYLLGGQVALLNNCIGQAEACFKLSISLIPEIPPRRLEDGQMKSTQQKVHALITNFFSTLLVVPDNIEANHRLYLLNGLLKAVHKLDWERTEQIYYSLLLKAIDLLSNLAQESYSYHISSVISNDLLYGSDKEFIQEINNLATSLSEEILIILKQLGDTKQVKKQQNLALELFWRVARRADINSGPMHTLAVNLWLLSQRDKESDNRFAVTLCHSLRYENDKSHMYDNLLKKIRC